jgi:hypothetical protein
MPYGYADDCGMLAIADTVEESTRLAHWLTGRKVGWPNERGPSGRWVP